MKNAIHIKKMEQDQLLDYKKPFLSGHSWLLTEGGGGGGGGVGGGGGGMDFFILFLQINSYNLDWKCHNTSQDLPIKQDVFRDLFLKEI